MSTRVSYGWAYAALVLLGARWWWAVFQALVRDVREAGAFSEGPAVVRRPALHAPAALDAGRRPPLNRVLAFRGVAQRVAQRRRWQGGFGRRGL